MKLCPNCLREEVENPVFEPGRCEKCGNYLLVAETDEAEKFMDFFNTKDF